MTARRIIAAAIGFALPGLLLYAGFAFTHWQTNPEFWGTDHRKIMITWSLLLGTFAAAAAATIPGDDA
jgi:hypothetical protein